MTREILLTGGTGKTGRRVADRLRARGVAPRVARRTPSGDGQVRFDWADPATFDGAFRDVEAACLVACSGTADPLAAMRPGLDRALDAGVRRSVLLSASSLEEDGPMMGRVRRYLRDHAPEWIVLCPTWFIQNLSDGQHQPTIRDEGALYSATDDGRVPFIDVDDIAAVALTDRSLPNGGLILTGPEALTYDQVAATLFAESDAAIKHRKLDKPAMAARSAQAGLPQAYVDLLAAMDGAIARGGEYRVTDTVERITGRPPTKLARFASRHRTAQLPD